MRPRNRVEKRCAQRWIVAQNRLGITGLSANKSAYAAQQGIGRDGLAARAENDVYSGSISACFAVQNTHANVDKSSVLHRELFKDCWQCICCDHHALAAVSRC